MKKMTIGVFAALCVASAAQGGRYNIVPSSSPDRVRTPLRVDMERIGTLAPRSAREVGRSAYRPVGQSANRLSWHIAALIYDIIPSA